LKIKKLTENDRTITEKFLNQESQFNIFLIGDLETHGMQTDFMQFWGSFSDQARLQGVLLKYYGSFIPYSYHDNTLKEFAKIINNHSDAKMLSGKKEIIEKIKEYFSDEKTGKIREEFFLGLNQLNINNKPANITNVKKATINDVDRILDMLDSVEEFSDLKSNREMKKNEMKKGSTRLYYFENKNGDIISTASSTAESSNSAMIVGVATRSEYRRQGYASKCVYQLSADLLQDNKKPCLFYDNYKAGKIYRRLGFEDLGGWTMININNP